MPPGEPLLLHTPALVTYADFLAIVTRARKFTRKSKCDFPHGLAEASPVRHYCTLRARSLMHSSHDAVQCGVAHANHHCSAARGQKGRSFPPSTKGVAVARVLIKDTRSKSHVAVNCALDNRFRVERHPEKGGAWSVHQEQPDRSTMREVVGLVVVGNLVSAAARDRSTRSVVASRED